MKQEKNKFIRAWIWLWYNNITRGLILIISPWIVALTSIWGGWEIHPNYIIGIWIFFFIWMIIDNDYSNLRRIGMNEYRNKLKQ